MKTCKAPIQLKLHYALCDNTFWHKTKKKRKSHMQSIFTSNTLQPKPVNPSEISVGNFKRSKISKSINKKKEK